LDYPGWRHNIELLAWSATMSGAALAGWSWTSGYVLASVARHTRWIAIGLFALMVFLGTLGTGTVARASAGAFAGHFLGVVLPRLVRFLLVLLPAINGDVLCSPRYPVSFDARHRCHRSHCTDTVRRSFLELSMTLGRGVYPSGAVIGS
jgi:hypothetical protein